MPDHLKHMAMKTKFPYIRVLNQTLNGFWTLFAFAPVLWFWVTAGPDHWLYIFLGTALLFSLLPRKLLHQFRIGNRRAIYEKMGVRFMRRFIQDGDWVRSLSDISMPWRIGNAEHAYKYLTTVDMYERFHWMCLVFFTESAVYAFMRGYVLIGVWMMATNIIYNVMSIMLQQYNRLRLHRLFKKLEDLQQ